MYLLEDIAIKLLNLNNYSKEEVLDAKNYIFNKKK